MRELFQSLLGYFLTPAGILVMGALDSSIVFFLPLGIDFVAIILTARHPDLFWFYAILAATGTVIGSGATFWLGRAVGEHGLAKLVKPSRLEKVQRRVHERAAYSLAALAIIPPPFPFTAFALTCGALRVDAWGFFVTLAGTRLLRFGVETALAAHYGRGIIAWMDSATFRWLIGGIILLAVGGTIVSAFALVRSTRRGAA